jgi:hypothetical protein
MMQERCRPLKDVPGKKQAHPSRTPQDAEPFKMAQGSCRTLWDGMMMM